MTLTWCQVTGNHCPAAVMNRNEAQSNMTASFVRHSRPHNTDVHVEMAGEGGGGGGGGGARACARVQAGVCVCVCVCVCACVCVYVCELMCVINVFDRLVGG